MVSSKRLLWIDPAMGMAGDMFAAALIGLGASKDGLVTAMSTAGQVLGRTEVEVGLVSLPDGTEIAPS